MVSAGRSERDAVRAAHHQIGNSLQSVVSLLNLERRVAPPEAADALAEAGRRVGTIMRLHQRLQETDGEHVRLDDLLADVCRDVAALDVADRDAEIRIDIRPLCARPRVAAALAIVTAELVGNALEHGLSSRPGIVEIGMRQTEGDEACLCIQDNGKGPDDGRLKPGFGLKLVDRLVSQLRGRLKVVLGRRGTQFEITCPGLWQA